MPNSNGDSIANNPELRGDTLQGCSLLVAALTKIAASGPEKAPEPENYDDTESAYNNGEDVAAFAAADIARVALAEFAAPPPASSPTMRAVIQEALEAWADQFDGDPNVDLNVSGSDLVDWFTDWRDRAKRSLRAPQKPVAKARLALGYLGEARDLLKEIEARRTLDRVRLAITSAGGAVRHAGRCATFLITVNYQTKGGEKTARVPVIAVDVHAAIAKASAQVRKRRGVVKIIGGAASEAR